MKKLLSNNVPVKKKAEKIKYPPTSRFYTRSKRCSLLILPKHELRKLARHGGHDIVSGFNPNSKVYDNNFFFFLVIHYYYISFRQIMLYGHILAQDHILKHAGFIEQLCLILYQLLLYN